VCRRTWHSFSEACCCPAEHVLDRGLRPAIEHLPQSSLSRRQGIKASTTLPRIRGCVPPFFKGGNPLTPFAHVATFISLRLLSSPLKNRSCFETRLRRSSARAVVVLSYNDFLLTLRRREAPSRRVAAFFNGLFRSEIVAKLQAEDIATQLVVAPQDVTGVFVGVVDRRFG
jgi:hypothetical protein